MNQDKINLISQIVNERIIPLRTNATSDQKKAIHQAIQSVCSNTVRYQLHHDAMVNGLNDDRQKHLDDQKIIGKIQVLFEALSHEGKHRLGSLITSLPLLTEALIKTSGEIAETKDQKRQLIGKWKNSISVLSLKFPDEFDAAIERLLSDPSPFSDIAVRGCISYGNPRALGTGAARYDKEISFAYHLRLTLEKWINPKQEQFEANYGEQLSENRFMHYSVINRIGHEIHGFDRDLNYRQHLYSLKKDYPEAHFFMYQHGVQ